MTDAPAISPTPSSGPSYARAMAWTAAPVGLAAWVGVGDTHGVAPALVALAYCLFLIRRRAFRARAVVAAEVTWLVLALLLKLVFLERLPATPLPVLAGVLGAQYLAQLVVDLRAFGA